MMKKEKERKKREAKEAEEALKREREMECQSELYLKRLQQRMVETEARSTPLFGTCIDTLSRQVAEAKERFGRSKVFGKS